MDEAPRHTINDELRRRAHEHPAIAEYLASRETLAAQVAQLRADRPPDPEATAAAYKFFGIEDSDSAHLERATSIIERLTGATPEAAAYNQEVATAHAATLAWMHDVTGVEYRDPELLVSMHEAAMRMRAVGPTTVVSPAQKMVQLCIEYVARQQPRSLRGSDVAHG